jgi:hypothetical protein
MGRRRLAGHLEVRRALRNLAEFLQQLGINIQQGIDELDVSWDGNASDAAYQYFSELAADISAQRLPLHDIGENYHEAAIGAWELSNQLGNILQALADWAIIAGVSAAAGTATAGTGVGAIFGYGLTALAVARMLERINEASRIMNTAGVMIVGLFSTGMDFGDRGGNLSATPLPVTAYSPPGA